MPKISEVAVRLLERTERDEIPWEAPNSEENEFVVGVGGLSISISKFNPHPLSGESNDGVILRIKDTNNKQIDYTATDEHEVEPYKLWQLYTKARRHALNVSGQLDEFIAELDKV